MTSCSFYHDAKGRIYYLPVKTIESYQRDSKPHTLPQGCKKMRTQDGHDICVLNNYDYPEKVRIALTQLSSLTEQEACANLAFLNITHIDENVGYSFVSWFFLNRGDGIFKTALAEKAFFRRDVELLKLTMHPEMKFYNEDLSRLAQAGRLDIIEVLSQHIKLDIYSILEGAVYGDKKEVFDWAGAQLEEGKSKNEIFEAYQVVLKRS